MNQAAPERSVGGPFFDDLTIGQTFGGAPGVTLTDGLAADVLDWRLVGLFA